jgi:hypothetical protein
MVEVAADNVAVGRMVSLLEIHQQVSFLDQAHATSLL